MMSDAWSFEETAAMLQRGDYTLLAPRFGDPAQPGLAASAIVDWFDAGAFAAAPELAAEALTCACWLGQTGVAIHLLDHCVSLTTGTGTGMSALHWAVNRGQLAAVRLLIARDADLEARNMYGGTALGAAIWAAIHEPKAEHLAIVELLLASGARTDEVTGPVGHAGIDALLSRHRKT